MLYGATIIHLKAATVAFLCNKADADQHMSTTGICLSHMTGSEEVGGIQAPLLCLDPSHLSILYR